MSETEAERELRLAKLDIDNPRPQFFKTDVARYESALREIAALRVEEN